MLRSLPTVQIPQWDPHSDDPTAIPIPSPFSDYPSLHRYLPSIADAEPDNDDDEFLSSAAADAFSCDHFRMFEFKIRRCARGRSHDWTECPFAHPGEKARRRDPRKHHYSGTACPDFRKGGCRRGDSCEFAHGVFECWLHPARYRTQPCKDGLSCRRRVCFFAHTPHQLRLLSPSAASDSDSPPESPLSLASSMRSLHIAPSTSYGSPRSGSGLRSGFAGSPSTPPKSLAWDRLCEVEPAMERVESGRNLRALMYARLSKENSLGRVVVVDSAGSGAPDVGWISELVN